MKKLTPLAVIGLLGALITTAIKFCAAPTEAPKFSLETIVPTPKTTVYVAFDPNTGGWVDFTSADSARAVTTELVNQLRAGAPAETVVRYKYIQVPGKTDTTYLNLAEAIGLDDTPPLATDVYRDSVAYPWGNAKIEVLTVDGQVAGWNLIADPAPCPDPVPEEYLPATTEPAATKPSPKRTPFYVYAGPSIVGDVDGGLSGARWAAAVGVQAGRVSFGMTLGKSVTSADLRYVLPIRK